MTGSEALDEMYKDVILDHHKEPRNKGSVQGCPLVREGFNPLCGDRVKIGVDMEPDGEHIRRCQFDGEGCSICMASTSILTEEMEGRTLVEAKKRIREFRDLMTGKKKPEDFEGDVQALAGVRRFPVRIKCALLGWTTLNDALELKSMGEDAGSGKSRTECPEYP